MGRITNFPFTFLYTFFVYLFPFKVFPLQQATSGLATVTWQSVPLIGNKPPRSHANATRREGNCTSQFRSDTKQTDPRKGTTREQWGTRTWERRYRPPPLPAPLTHFRIRETAIGASPRHTSVGVKFHQGSALIQLASYHWSSASHTRGVEFSVVVPEKLTATRLC